MGPSRRHLRLSCLLSCRQIFHPETTDIYDKKNMPRVVYCIHALRWASLRRPRGPTLSSWFTFVLMSLFGGVAPPQGWGDTFGCCRGGGEGEVGDCRVTAG